MRNFTRRVVHQFAALRAACRAQKAHFVDCILLGLYGITVVQNAQAAMLTGFLCKGYSSVFDNSFIGLAAMTSFTVLLLKWKFADKSTEAMSGMTKTGIALSALLSMPQIMGWFNVQPC